MMARRQLRTKRASLLGIKGSLERCQGKFIHGTAGQTGQISAALGMDSHQLAIIGILQSVEKEVIQHPLMSHPKTATSVIQQIGGTAHALHATSNHNPVVANPDRICCQHHRLHTRTTHLVDCGCGDRWWQSRFQHRLPGGSLPHPGRQHVAHKDFVDLLGMQTALLQCSLDGTRPQLRCRHLCQCPLKCPHRGPLCRHNRNIHLPASFCYMAIT